MPAVAQGPEHEEELDLRAYLDVVLRRWKAIAVVMLLVILAVLLLTVRQGSRYRAESEILIRQSDTASVIGNQNVDASNAARSLNNDLRLFESGTVQDAVQKAYHGPLDPKDVHADVESDTADVLRAHLTASDPEAAAKLVNLYVDTFIQVRRQQRTNEVLAVGEAVQAKISDLDGRIAQADAKSLPALQSQRTFYESQLDDLELSKDITETSGAQVLTRADAPDTPVSPRPVRDLALAVVLGLVLGIGVAFLVDSLDERIRSMSDLERMSGGLPILTVVPVLDRKHDDGFVAVRDEARSPQAEAYRALRTAVKFAGLDKPIRVLQVTSAHQAAGKTTTVSNLAVAFSQAGERTAVICCDLRRPRVQERFGLPLSPGLTDVLAGDAPLDVAVRRYAPNLVVLPAGTLSTNPSELLSAQRTEDVVRAMAAELAMVIIDSTPILPVTDALVVSRMVDATLVVVDGRNTTRKALRRTLQMLSQAGAPVIGLVLLGITDDARYGYGYGYGGYGADHDKPSRKGRSASPGRAAAAPRPSTPAFPR